MSELRISPSGAVEFSEVFGAFDHNLELVEKATGCSISYRGDQIIVNGDESEKAAFIVNELFKAAENGQILDDQKVGYIITLASEGVSYSESNISRDVICFTFRGKPLKAKKGALLLSSHSPGVYDAAIAQFKGFTAYVNMENAGVITAHGDENKSDSKMNEIRDFAKKL